MRFSRWQAQGNVYLVAEEPLSPERVRAEVGDADGILEVKGRGRDWIEIAIWNADGSLAEMSGNGTRIAARWLGEARVWERGVGETESSGTSAIAVAAALGAKDAKIRFPGGDLHVRLDGEFAYLTGTAELSSGFGAEP